MKKKALVAMSGGVDSAVSAYLAMENGYECVGATMLLCDRDTAASDAADAAAVCRALGISHHVIDFRNEFKRYVIDSFVASYEKGSTPNPCIVCNRHLKFGLLYEKALSLGCDTIVTGHYARIEDGFLKKAKDISKDQSYVLYCMDRALLGHVYLPLGHLTKAEARAIALEQGFVSARKSDSQDICFVPGGDYASVIESYTKKTYPKGSFVDTKGNVLGEHSGIIRYTVGQRKGLGIAFGKPMYVKSKNADKNEVTLSTDEELFDREITASDFNLLVPMTTDVIEAKAKIRYNQTEQPATVFLLDGGRARIVFDSPQRAAASGQSVVVYDGDIVVGGGVID